VFVLPDQVNILQILIYLVILVLTLFMWCPAPGYLVITRPVSKTMGEGHSADDEMSAPGSSGPTELTAGGHRYQEIAEDRGEAFCAGCRTLGRSKGMLYSKETDTYYHRKCLPH
jgi:hypothetical protein